MPVAAFLATALYVIMAYPAFPTGEGEIKLMYALPPGTLNQILLFWALISQVHRMGLDVEQEKGNNRYYITKDIFFIHVHFCIHKIGNACLVKKKKPIVPTLYIF